MELAASGSEAHGYVDLDHIPGNLQVLAGSGNGELFHRSAEIGHRNVYMQHVLGLVLLIIICTPLLRFAVQDNGPFRGLGDHEEGIFTCLYRLAAEGAILVKSDRSSFIGAATIDLTVWLQLPEDLPSLLHRTTIGDRDILCAQGIVRAVRMRGLGGSQEPGE